MHFLTLNVMMLVLVYCDFEHQCQGSQLAAKTHQNQPQGCSFYNIYLFFLGGGGGGGGGGMSPDPLEGVVCMQSTHPFSLSKKVFAANIPV